MDEEIWVKVPKFPLYEVSNLGRVRRITYQTQWPNSDGYPQVKFWDENRCVGSAKVHRLVAEAFVPNPEGKPEVEHKDGNKLNPRSDNLMWVTRKENQQRAVAMGLRDTCRGERVWLAKLKECQVRCIRAFRRTGWRQKSIARHFGISKNTVMAIHNGRVWKWLK